MRQCMEEVRFLLKARTECIWINTYEETQAINDLQEVIIDSFPTCKLQVWSNTEGLKSIPLTAGEKVEPADPRLREVPALFAQIRNDVLAGQDRIQPNVSPIVYVLRDLHNLMADARTRRCIRDVKEYNSTRYLPIVVIAPSNEIHDEVAKLFKIVDYELPDKELVGKLVDEANQLMERAIKQGKKYEPIKDKDTIQDIVNSCVGLTQKEIDSLLLRSVIKYKTINLDYIAEEKIEAIRKSGTLDYKQPEKTLKDVGGHELFKEWFYEMKELYRPEAREFGLPKPKGTLLLGVPGTSKTASAEAIAGELKVPFVTLNMSKILSRLVGSSEQNMETAIKLVKAIGPCVFLIDELEKEIGLH